jgi:hypothetical protein
MWLCSKANPRSSGEVVRKKREKDVMRTTKRRLIDVE